MAHRIPSKKEKPKNPWTKPQKVVLGIIIVAAIVAIVLSYVGGII